MKFVITGATSFIGLELTRCLLNRRHTVIAVARMNSNGISSVPKGVKVITLEMRDYGRLHDEIRDADVFINLAWGGTGHDGRNVADIQNENVEYTTSAMFSAKKMACKLFIEAGSQAEYGSTTKPQTEDSECNPFSEYGKAKLRVKENLFSLSERLNIKYIHLRLFSVFGENDHPWTLVMDSIDKMLGNKSLALSSCTQNWNFLYVNDAAQLIVRLCEKTVGDPEFQHEVFNIASKDTRPLREFVERMKVLANSTSELNYGVVNSPNYVSLQPDISKIVQATDFQDFHGFDDVVLKIINSKRVN